MKPISYCAYREGEYYVTQCLNLDISTFGRTREEAVDNLKEAIDLYFQDQAGDDYVSVSDVTVGEELWNE